MKRFLLYHAVPMLVLTFTLALGPWAAGAVDAEPDSCQTTCRSARVECQQGLRDDSRLCRSTCRDTIRGAITAERENCDIEALPEDECRTRVVTAARAAAEACLPDCRQAVREQKGECRREARTCMVACRGELDPVCAEECRDTFRPCAEDLQACRRTCHQDRREATRACRESSTNRAEFRQCRVDSLTASRECTVDCHDTHLCREQVRGCMDTCRLDAGDDV